MNKIPTRADFDIFKKQLGEKKIFQLEESARKTAKDIMEALDAYPRDRHERILAAALGGTVIAQLYMEKYGEYENQS